MTTESNIPPESSLVEVSTETRDMVNREMPNETDKVKNETMALIEAIKKRAQAEIQGASQLTSDAYLTAIHEARTAVEQNQLFDKDRIEYTMKLIQMDAQKNWESILKEISVFGDRLSDAAKAAWEALTAPRSDDNSNV